MYESDFLSEGWHSADERWADKEVQQGFGEGVNRMFEAYEKNLREAGVDPDEILAYDPDSYDPFTEEVVPGECEGHCEGCVKRAYCRALCEKLGLIYEDEDADYDRQVGEDLDFGADEQGW
jgi:hypothetical protein